MDELYFDNDFKTFIDALNGIAEIDDELLTDEAMPAILQNVNTIFSTGAVNEAVDGIIRNLEAQQATKAEAEEGIHTLREVMEEIVYGEHAYTGNKKKLIDTVLETTFDVMNMALEKYHSYAIELPIMLEEGAQEPTYAHETDACADMYAMEEIEIPAHFQSVPVKTGVHIQLPEGWVALLFPRSSIGAKTALRLSNSVGIIDSGYRGEVRALYDNTGDESYTIHKGDRIAQMMVMPSYRFKAKIVDSLEDSDRGSGGFGSTGV